MTITHESKDLRRAKKALAKSAHWSAMKLAGKSIEQLAKLYRRAVRWANDPMAGRVKAEATKRATTVERNWPN